MKIYHKEGENIQEGERRTGNLYHTLCTGATLLSLLFQLFQCSAEILPAEHFMAVFKPNAIRLPTRRGDTGDFRNKVLRRLDVVQRGFPLATQEHCGSLGIVRFIVADKDRIRQVLHLVNEGLNFLLLTHGETSGMDV